MKLLNVKKTTTKELYEKWGVILPLTYFGHELYIRCNSKGIINWDIAPIFTKQELKHRGSFNILK